MTKLIILFIVFCIVGVSYSATSQGSLREVNDFWYAFIGQLLVILFGGWQIMQKMVTSMKDTLKIEFNLMNKGLEKDIKDLKESQKNFVTQETCLARKELEETEFANIKEKIEDVRRKLN